MRVLIKKGIKWLPICLLISTTWTLSVSASVDKKFRLDADTLKNISEPSKSSPKIHLKSKKLTKQIVAMEDETVLAVKAGDTIEKLLIRDCNMADEELGPIVVKITKRNKILNIRRLYIGQKIIIPPGLCPSTGIKSLTKAAPISGNKPGNLRQVIITEPPKVEVTRHLDKPSKNVKVIAAIITALDTKPIVKHLATPVAKKDVLPANSPKPTTKSTDSAAMLKAVWENIVPAQKDENKVLTFKSESFTLSLDPARYRLFSAMDGSRILIDHEKNITPQYKSLISAQEPNLQIIIEPLSDEKHFLASLLGVAKFYSVEEDFNLEFGVDPRLEIRSDFKVERTSDSLYKNEVILLNAAKTRTLPSVISFLKNQGFTLHEPFATSAVPLVTRQNILVQITAKTEPKIVDALLAALSLPVEQNKYLEVTPAKDSGIKLSIKLERAFEQNGKRYVILCSDDPAAASISAILKSGGENVIVFKSGDNFSTIAEKILGGLGIRAKYGFQYLWPVERANVSLQLSGIMIEGVGQNGGSLFITDREITSGIMDIAAGNGYIFKGCD